MKTPAPDSSVTKPVTELPENIGMVTTPAPPIDDLQCPCNGAGVCLTRSYDDNASGPGRSYAGAARA